MALLGCAYFVHVWHMCVCVLACARAFVCARERGIVRQARGAAATFDTRGMVVLA